MYVDAEIDRNIIFMNYKTTPNFIFIIFHNFKEKTFVQVRNHTLLTRICPANGKKVRIADFLTILDNCFRFSKIKSYGCLVYY